MNCQTIINMIRNLENLLANPLLPQAERVETRVAVLALQRQCAERGCNPNLARR